MSEQIRRERLLPNGEPRYVRCYDNGGETADRFTVVYTGRYRHNTGGEQLHVCMSASPFHPQGVGQHGSLGTSIDTPSYRHLGKRIAFRDLPEDCRTLVLGDYRELWGL
jgi:hypothetical protein